VTAGIPSCRTLEPVRDRVVALCGDIDGARVLDVGCGSGLVGRALLPGVGSNGTVTFLDHDASAVRELESSLAGDPRAMVVADDAVRLERIATGSMDLVVMRAVLLYLPGKVEALRAAVRVLVPGGRIVMSEPVNRPLYYPAERFWGFDLSSIPEIAAKVQHGFTSAAPPEVRAMTTWDDVDLATDAADAGLDNVRMETITEFVPGPPVPWLAFLYGRWTPWMPNLASVLRAQLSDAERETFENVVRPQLAEGRQRMIVRNTFITASTPG
jgi:ubiquinone/menaquinone biosynthesis C-methylase UbiE